MSLLFDLSEHFKQFWSYPLLSRISFSRIPLWYHLGTGALFFFLKIISWHYSLFPVWYSICSDFLFFRSMLGICNSLENQPFHLNPKINSLWADNIILVITIISSYNPHFPILVFYQFIYFLLLFLLLSKIQLLDLCYLYMIFNSLISTLSFRVFITICNSFYWCIY